MRPRARQRFASTLATKLNIGQWVIAPTSYEFAHMSTFICMGLCDYNKKGELSHRNTRMAELGHSFCFVAAVYNGDDNTSRGAYISAGNHVLCPDCYHELIEK